jgi:hypothetical protein
MRKFILMTTLIIMLTACAPLTPVSSVSAPTAPAAPHNNYAPNSADSGLTRGEAYLDSSELSSRPSGVENFSRQFNLELTGNLPTPCHQLRVAIRPPDADKKVVVDVYTVTDPNAICIQMLAPFDANIPLGSYPSGHYYLIVKGNQVTEFDS